MDGFVWVSEGKEVENYISDDILSSITKSQNLSIDKFEGVFDHPKIKNVTTSKVELAHQVVEKTTSKHLAVLNLSSELMSLCKRIREWNGH